MSKSAPISVILLTGFLGSGKTTLLNQLLSSDSRQRIVVIENELGEQGLDSRFLKIQPPELIELNQGCLCCGAQDQLMRILGRLMRQRDSFDTLIIEATGLADPAALMMAFGEEDLRQVFRLHSVIALIDAKHFWRQQKLDGVCLRQIALADTLLVNKADLVTTAELKQLNRYLLRINPLASLQVTQFARIHASQLRQHQHFHRQQPVDPAPLHQAWMAVSLECAGVMDPDALSAWLSRLLFTSSHTLLRLKGIVNLASSPVRRYLIQGVCSQLEGSPDRPWGVTEARLNQLVLIGHPLDHDALQTDFAACLQRF